MARGKRLRVKTRRLPEWLVNREYRRKKNNQPIQNKKNTARIKDGNITKNEQIITIIKVK